MVRMVCKGPQVSRARLVLRECRVSREKMENRVLKARRYGCAP